MSKTREELPPIGPEKDDKLLVMRAYSDTVRYVQGEFVNGDTVDAKLTVRDWDVTDPEARNAAAEAELGEIDEWYRQHAAWCVKPEENSAVLCVYRPKEMYAA